MKINVDGINEGSRVLQANYTAQAMGFGDSDFDFQKTVDLTAKVTRMGLDVLVECEIRTVVTQSCCRCLENFGLEVATAFQTLFVPEKPPKSYRHDIRRPLVSDEDDKVTRYKGKEIDLSRGILEAIQLFLPMKPLCHSGCKGLCPSCGVNRNVSTCRCGEGAGSAQYHPFRDLKWKAE
ncbi:MAG: DUF177 domain-containing protein [Planctomycetes bacterium]|nr:DUF177 domain-containing protein [Planctomycetota bacterium]